jgi:hypothetical protein
MFVIITLLFFIVFIKIYCICNSLSLHYADTKKYDDINYNNLYEQEPLYNNEKLSEQEPLYNNEKLSEQEPLYNNEKLSEQNVSLDNGPIIIKSQLLSLENNSDIYISVMEDDDPNDWMNL